MSPTPMKKLLKDRFGTLRNAATKSGIDYYRVVNASSGYLSLREEELKRLGVPHNVAKATLKVKHDRVTA